MNPGRGDNRMNMASRRTVASVRERLAALVKLDDPGRVILTSGCTYATNTAMRGWRPGGAGSRSSSGTPPHVVITQGEHNAVLRPALAMAEAGLIRLSVAPLRADGVLDPDAVLGMVIDETLLVCVQHASNVSGVVQDVGAVGRGLRERDRAARLLVDGAQSIGLVAMDMEAMGIDLLAVTCHKAVGGPSGTGALFVGPRCAAAEDWDPPFHGGTGGDSSTPHNPTQWPHRLEIGSPNIIGIAGLEAALGDLDRAGNLAHEQALARRLSVGLASIEGVTLYGPAWGNDSGAAGGGVGCGGAAGGCGRIGNVALNFEEAGGESLDCHEAAAILDTRFDIACRAGLHCNPGTHAVLGSAERGGCLRLSVGPPSRVADVDAAIAAVRDIATAEGVG